MRNKLAETQQAFNHKVFIILNKTVYKQSKLSKQHELHTSGSSSITWGIDILTGQKQNLALGLQIVKLPKIGLLISNQPIYLYLMKAYSHGRQLI